MMGFRKISAAGAGKLIAAYLTENVKLEAKPDGAGSKLTNYYGRDSRASWRQDMPPDIAAALGIDPAVAPTSEGLARLFEAKRADNGEAWTQHHRDISAYDLTVSPEKSVSLAFQFAKTDEEKAAILQAIWKANDRAMRAVASEVGWARRGDGGEDGAEPGNVAWASFMHFTARPTHAVQDGANGETHVVEIQVPGDPQVHIHNAMFNAVATESGHVGSLDTKELQGRVKEFGGLFQAFLAVELDRLGIRLEYDQHEQAVSVACIPQEVRTAFSKGNKATVRKAKLYAVSQGLDWEGLAAEKKLEILNNTAQHTRLQKHDGKPDPVIWDELAQRIGWKHETAITGERREALTDAQRMERAVKFVARHVEEEFKTAAVIDMNVIRMHAARSLIGPGIKGAREVDAVVRRLETVGITVDGRHSSLITGVMDGKLRVTHSVQVALEREMGQLVRVASRSRVGALTEADFQRGLAQSGVKFTGRVGRDQEAASRSFVLGGGLVFLEGAAGVGKTRAVLPPAVEAWKNAGRRVIGISQAWKQSDELKDSGITETIAISPFLASVKAGELVLDRNTVLVIDEAAQLGPRQFLEIMRMWREHGVIVRGLGDREQCQAIEASSAVEIMGRNMPEAALPKLLETVRQKTARAREISDLFRDGRAAQALDMKIEDRTATLVGGDYDQVVDRIATFYLQRVAYRQTLGPKERRSVTVTALTNADSAAISKAIRTRLRDRGEIAGEETVYQATDNRGERYNLPVAVGDRFRLYKKTYALVDGKRGFIGSNGNVVTMAGRWEGGLILRDEKGREGRVEWKRLVEQGSGRLLLGYGHCLTVDSAQGITSGEHINALPRGSAGITAFKGYVAESRHVDVCWTMISKGAEIQAEMASRPLGAPTEVTEREIWTRVGKNMSEKPYKALGIDLVDKASRSLEDAVDRFIQTDARLRAHRDSGPDLKSAVQAEVRDRALKRALKGKMQALGAAVQRQGEVIGDLRTGVTESLAGLRERIEQDLRPMRARPKPRAQGARPGIR